MALGADINVKDSLNQTGGSPMAYGAPASSGFGLGLSVNPVGAVGNEGIIFNAATGGSSLSANQSASGGSGLASVPWYVWLAIGGGVLLWFMHRRKKGRK